MEYHPDFTDPENPYAAPQSEIRKPPGFPEIGEAGPARVRFDAIGQAWELISQQRGTWALMVLVFYAIYFAVNIGLGFIFGIAQVAVTGPNPKGDSSAALVVILITSNVVNIVVNLIVQGYLTAGMYRAACRQLRGMPIQVADIFSAGDVVWPFVGGMILNALAICGGLILFFIPGWLIWGRLMFVSPLIADGRMGPGEALGASWRALRGQSWISFAFILVTSIVTGLGVLLCCVGLLFTFPIHPVAVAILYNDFFFKSKPIESPWIEPV